MPRKKASQASEKARAKAELDATLAPLVGRITARERAAREEFLRELEERLGRPVGRNFLSSLPPLGGSHETP